MRLRISIRGRVRPSVRSWVRLYVPWYFRTTNVTVYEGKKSSKIQMTSLPMIQWVTIKKSHLIYPKYMVFFSIIFYLFYYSYHFHALLVNRISSDHLLFFTFFVILSPVSSFLPLGVRLIAPMNWIIVPFLPSFFKCFSFSYSLVQLPEGRRKRSFCLRSGKFTARQFLFSRYLVVSFSFIP